MVRVDDRLIHGQIVAAWVKSLNLERVWIIDDGTANDNFLKNVMRMVAPSNTELVISAESEIEQLASQYDKDDCRTLSEAKKLAIGYFKDGYDKVKIICDHCCVWKLDELHKKGYDPRK